MRRHVWTAPSRQGLFLVFRQADQVRSCIRPLCAVHGPLALREYVVGFRSFRRAVMRDDATECPDPGL
jgi:hypothetical protein